MNPLKGNQYSQNETNTLTLRSPPYQYITLRKGYYNSPRSNKQSNQQCTYSWELHVKKQAKFYHKHHKIYMISNSYTITNPRTMMVKSSNTTRSYNEFTSVPITHSAVEGPRRHEDMTIATATHSDNWVLINADIGEEFVSRRGSFTSRFFRKGDWSHERMGNH